MSGHGPQLPERHQRPRHVWYLQFTMLGWFAIPCNVHDRIGFLPILGLAAARTRPSCRAVSLSAVLQDAEGSTGWIAPRILGVRWSSHLWEPASPGAPLHDGVMWLLCFGALLHDCEALCIPSPNEAMLSCQDTWLVIASTWPLIDSRFCFPQGTAARPCSSEVGLFSSSCNMSFIILGRRNGGEGHAAVPLARSCCFKVWPASSMAPQQLAWTSSWLTSEAAAESRKGCVQ